MLPLPMITEIVLVLCAALVGAYMLGPAYRQRGDVSSPGGTQAARILFWFFPVLVFGALVLVPMRPLAPALALTGATAVAAVLGLLLLPQGGCMSMGRGENREKWDVRLLLTLGLPFNAVTCFIGLGLFGAGRLALLVSPVALEPLVTGGQPLWWLYWAVAGGVLHGVAYAQGWRGPVFPGKVDAGTESGEYLWGVYQGLVLGPALTLPAAVHLRAWFGLW